MAKGPKPLPLADRLLRYFEVGDETDCWVWRGAVAKGYGKLGMGRKAHKRYDYAHRLVFELAFGPIPQGKWILHKCDTPLCVNPNHLYAGTPAQNSQDMIERKRHRCGYKIYWENKTRKE